MINIDDFKKVDLRIAEIGGEKVVVVIKGENKRILVANGVLIVPDGDVEIGSKIS